MRGPSRARLAAAHVLERVETKGAFAPIALTSAIQSHDLAPMDRNLATEIVYGVLRWRGRLDFYLSRFSKRRIGSLSPWVRNAMRIGAFHVLFHDSVPIPVALSESVELAKVKERYAAGYVNAVLRAFVRGRASVRFPDPDKDIASYLETWESHPRWLVERWLAAWGNEGARSLCATNNAPADITLRVNVAKTSVEDVRAGLLSVGIEPSMGRLTPHALRVRAAGSVEGLPGFEQGLFHIQDEGSQLVGWAVAPDGRGPIADVCAGPGGKTTHLAELWHVRSGRTEPPVSAPIVAFDLHDHRTALITSSAARLGLDRLIRVHTADARAISPDVYGTFSRVLVDAPCTGTGVLRRRPDLRWQKSPEDVAALVQTQREILTGAERLVAKGGTLVYSTCSLEPEENIENARWFLARFPEFRPESMADDLPSLANLARDRFALDGAALQLAPHLDGTDGMFIFRAIRREVGK